MTEGVMEKPAPLSRREFLFYIWGASITLSLAGSAGAILWFAYPRFREGEFGGVFRISAGNLPTPEAPPEEHPEGRFWLVNTGTGILAIYKVCTHLGCLYKWVPSNNRFECPCHGSKYQRDGTWIEGPAPRTLDRFVVQAVDSEGAVLTETAEGDMNTDPQAGQPVEVPASAVEIEIDTGNRIKGPVHG
jgi:cytochrome b6-f complex iron-sulfur subunit